MQSRARCGRRLRGVERTEVVEGVLAAVNRVVNDRQGVAPGRVAGDLGPRRDELVFRPVRFRRVRVTAAPVLEAADSCGVRSLARLRGVSNVAVFALVKI